MAAAGLVACLIADFLPDLVADNASPRPEQNRTAQLRTEQDQVSRKGARFRLHLSDSRRDCARGWGCVGPIVSVQSNKLINKFSKQINSRPMTRFIIKRVVFIAAKYLNRPRLTFSSKITERNFATPSLLLPGLMPFWPPFVSVLWRRRRRTFLNQ